jgi:FtsH-binding integral membrane protein
MLACPLTSEKDDGENVIHESPQHAIDLLIAEFQALRGEVENALSAQQTMININITAIAVASGLVLSHKVDPLFLLVAAAISSGLGLYVEGSWHHIRRVLRYIDGSLRPLAIEYTGDERVLAWEKWSLAHGGAWKRVIPVGLATVIIFSAMPAAMLVWTIPHIESLGVWLAWAGTAIVFVLQLSMGALLAWNILRRGL